MEKTNGNLVCDLCGQDRHEWVYALHFDNYPGPFQLWRCRECGAICNWPRLSDPLIHDQYNADYYVFSAPATARWAKAAQLYLSFGPSLPPRHNGRRLLEIGCAGGELLAIAQHFSWEAEGIEISAEAARSAAAEFDIKVHAGTLEDRGPDLGTFDVVIANDVIEHITSPRRFVMSIRKVLRPGGVAVIGTPNWNSLWRRMFGRRWIGQNRFHIYLFNASCLKRLIQSCGFRRCALSSFTNCTHVEWGTRPEVDNLIRHLPAGLRWRAQRRLNQATPQSSATDLKRNPPANLNEALAKIEAYSPMQNTNSTNRKLSGDNLIAIARL